MKIRLHSLLATAACFLVFGCTPEITELNYSSPEETEGASHKIELSKESLTLREGHTSTLVATVRPWSAQGKSLTWTSSSPEVASVDENGLITALSIGETTIIIECDGVTARCDVTVISWEIPIESVEIDTTPISLKVNESKTLSAVILPENTTDQLIITSSDETIASVDAAGTVTALKTGTATISITAGSFNFTIPVMVHGDLWLEQTDALLKPVSFESFPNSPDTIRVARGETATLQTIVYADAAQGQIYPSVKYFSLEGQKSGIAVEPEIYWLPDIKCTNHWDSWAGGPAPDRYPDEEKYFPDPMMPVEEYSVSLSEGQKHALWFEFDIPRDLPAGIYEGCVTIQGTDTGELPFVVQVYDVTLPEKQTMDVLQWLGNNLAAMNGGVAPNKNTTYQMLEEKVIPMVSKFGQNSFRALYYDKPSYSHAVRNSDGSYKVIFDFSDLKKEIEMFLRACPDMHYFQGKTGSMLVQRDNQGIGQLVLRGFEVDENGELKVTDNGDGTYAPIYTYGYQQGEYIAESAMYAKQYFSALQEFLQSQTLPDGRTWLDIFIQAICDEPNDIIVPAYENIARYIRAAAPGIKIMDPLGTDKIDAELIDIPCPCIDIAVFKGEGVYPWNDEIQTRWIYSAVGPQGDAINRFIRIPLIKTRLMHWLNYRYSAVGYLHWGPNYWEGAPNGDPWKDAYGDFIGGDMWIIWPGDNTCYPSIRLAAMRDGIRDFELFNMLGKTDPVKAMELCRNRVSNFYTHNTDIEGFRDVRKTLLELLEMQ